MFLYQVTVMGVNPNGAYTEGFGWDDLVLQLTYYPEILPNFSELALRDSLEKYPKHNSSKL